MSRALIGLSGWNYKGWRGDFYPDGLRHKDELAFAASRFPTIEINGTFYSLKKPADFELWRAVTPKDFVFAVKGSRFITHMKQLREPRIPLANFLAQGVLRLEEKLGPLLWQFPERMRLDDARLQRFDEFLSLLPRDTEEAAALAREHGPQVRKGVALDVEKKRRIRHAVEVRHESFFDERFIRLLRKHSVALVASDAKEWRYAEDLTAGFVYVRLHGSERTYTSRYTDDQLDRLAAAIDAWVAGAEPADAIKA
ncbi:MAG TPA: DUF72 domain-containing protein, partial [Thermoanaerobaculia bacterium]